MKNRPRSIAAAVSVCAAALFAAVVTPADASESANTGQVAQDPHDHAMGSQIRKHEGTKNQPHSPSQINKPVAQLLSGSVYGIDVSNYQAGISWATQWNNGKRFAWIKATEGTSYTSPSFSSQYTGSYNQGFIRGAYHFALPSASSGATQANYFSSHGGGWSGDGKTLPGTLDVEWNPYDQNNPCYGKTKAQMTAWIKDFSDTYKARWNKYPAIYTSTSWWNQCVGADFSSTNPLWVARYASSPGTLPAGWGTYSVWQYSSSPIDQDVFNGSATQLHAFATNHD